MLFCAHLQSNDKKTIFCNKEDASFSIYIGLYLIFGQLVWEWGLLKGGCILGYVNLWKQSNYRQDKYWASVGWEGIYDMDLVDVWSLSPALIFWGVLWQYMFHDANYQILASSIRWSIHIMVHHMSVYIKSP